MSKSKYEAGAVALVLLFILKTYNYCCNYNCLEFKFKVASKYSSAARSLSLCEIFVGSTTVSSLLVLDSSLVKAPESCSALTISSTFLASKRNFSSRNFSRSAALCSLRCFSAKRKRSFSATLRSISTRYLSKMAASASSLMPKEEPGISSLLRKAKM
ncbi:hypothetical protein FF38_04767 [Lucilia cuprina]|uniref:Uncharacterized protein n=1 Tax=Lucilia cuprina TaxID=7375 RepID=A0A0L0BTV1_LUCCU|nr:hypothetical protein FF38_04767 [Lucilia cuprina]